MAEASWGDCSAHSSPHCPCGSPEDLLPRPRHRGADTPRPFGGIPFPAKLLSGITLSGTDVCRASTCFIWGYFSTVPAGLSRDESVKYRPGSGEKLVTIATGSIAIPAERWYNMEKDVENCRTGTDKLGICLAVRTGHLRTSPLSWCGNLHRISGDLSSSIRREWVSRPPEFRDLFGAGRETRPLRCFYGWSVKFHFVALILASLNVKN